MRHQNQRNDPDAAVWLGCNNAKGGATLTTYMMLLAECADAAVWCRRPGLQWLFVAGCCLELSCLVAGAGQMGRRFPNTTFRVQY